MHQLLGVEQKVLVCRISTNRRDSIYANNPLQCEGMPCEYIPIHLKPSATCRWKVSDPEKYVMFSVNSVLTKNDTRSFIIHIALPGHFPSMIYLE